MSSLRVSAKAYPKDALSRSPRGRAYLGISLNTRTAQTYAKFARTLQWAAANVDGCDVLVGDYLHRHNHQLRGDVNEEAATARALAEGDATIARIRPLLIEQSLGHSEIITARVLQKDSSFTRRFARFREWYEGDSVFRILIDEAVDKFLVRSNRSLLGDATARAHCRDYQLEELAMFEMLAETGHTVLVYPGSQLPVLKSIALRQLDVTSSALHELSLVELKFFEE